MKKTTLFCIFALVLSSCGIFRKTETQQVQDPATFDERVVINGVRWATRNVDMPGTFTETPEDRGMLFQWNRKTALWSVYDERIEDRRNFFPVATEWYAENDPCPTGWRVPTDTEFRSLMNAGGEWTTQNDVNGLLFGTAPYQIFLPATDISAIAGNVRVEGKYAIYWSNKQYTCPRTDHGTAAVVMSSRTGMSVFWQENALLVRCVAKN